MQQNLNLHDQMSSGADVCLIFDGDDGKKDHIYAHQTILKLHSSVLANALEAHTAGCQGSGTSGSSKSSSNAVPVINMPGTSKQDFRSLATFLYPLVPLPKVNWENLEVLLVQGSKWDMQIVLAHADEFIQANSTSMNSDPKSPKYVFKWLQLADAVGLQGSCSACIKRAVQLRPAQPWVLPDGQQLMLTQTEKAIINNTVALSSTATASANAKPEPAADQWWLEALSPRTLANLIDGFAGLTVYKHCPNCKRMMAPTIMCNGCRGTLC